MIEITEAKLKRLLIESLADSPTALICNAYDFMGLHCPCTDSGIICQSPDFPPMVGEAITIKLECGTPPGEYVRKPGDSGAELYYEMNERIYRSELPRVVIIETIGNKRGGAVLGDGMAKMLLATGAAGCVTDGPVRDIGDVIKTGLKIFSAGLTPNHYGLVWSGLGEPVCVGGLTVKTGDIVHGDRDGVIVLPKEGWAKVTRACRYVMDFEKAAHVIFRRTDQSPTEKGAAAAALSEEYMKKVRAIDDYEDMAL